MGAWNHRAALWKLKAVGFHAGQVVAPASDACVCSFGDRGDRREAIKATEQFPAQGPVERVEYGGRAAMADPGGFDGPGCLAGQIGRKSDPQQGLQVLGRMDRHAILAVQSF